MRRTSLRPTLLLSVVFATVANAQSPITGTWVTDAFDGTPNLIDLEVNGSTVIGAISRNHEVYAIHDGRISGNTVTFNVTVAWGGHRRVSFTGRLDNDILSFTRSVQNLPGQVTSGGQGIFRGDGMMEFEARREASGGTTIPRGFLANWRLNLQRSTYSSGTVPQPMIAQVLTLVAYPGGWFSVYAAGVTPNGTPFFNITGLKTDGKEYPQYNALFGTAFLISGTPSPLAVAVNRVDARTLEFTNRNNGTVTSINRWAVSPDGSTLTMSTREMNAGGEVTAMNTLVWERLFSASPDAESR